MIGNKVTMLIVLTPAGKDALKFSAGIRIPKNQKNTFILIF